MTPTKPDPPKNCPFCNSDKLIKLSRYVGPLWVSFIECSECESQGPTVYHETYQHDQAGIEACQLWNERVNHVTG
jgi:Restriction alleviation protein Lar